MGDRSRNILVCLTESEDSIRAAQYVGRLIGGAPGYNVTLLSIVDDPPFDYFKDEEERIEFVDKKQKRVEMLLNEARRVLFGYGFQETAVKVKTYVRACASIAQCILDEQIDEDVGTLVIARRKTSRSEEFLFGSVSNKIIHLAKDCAVWVVN
ncbi:MAG: universal stress protein [Deltaproteobacteria bacterium]|nr:universal stress protein [Deltaproteobacteria bacterium]